MDSKKRPKLKRWTPIVVTTQGNHYIRIFSSVGIRILYCCRGNPLWLP
ncbi:MAG: hypothetical protein KAI83_04170 [Thiomargarita sp.]|nr:hypothetical protein [Thiomargarita sp.]